MRNRLPVMRAALAGAGGLVIALGMLAGPAPAQAGTAVRAHPAAGNPPGCGDIKRVGTGTPGCAYITGTATFSSPRGTVVFPASLMNIDLVEQAKISKSTLTTYSSARLYYQGHEELAPAQASFVVNGLHIKATIEVTQLAPGKVVSVAGIKGPPYPVATTFITTVSARVYHVTVDGTPVSVGPHCETRPFPLVLRGKGKNTIPPTGYAVPTGGPLTGTAHFPPLRGCGTSGRSRLVLPALSPGPAHLALEQGAVCLPSVSSSPCPPSKPGS